jgi:hypothetical protein
MKATCWELDRSASGGTGTAALCVGLTPLLLPAGMISGVMTVGLHLYRGDSDVVWNAASCEDIRMDNGRSKEGPSLEHTTSKVSSDRNANARASAREAT